MDNSIIKTVEGSVYRIQMTVAGVEDFTQYRVYGGCVAIGGCGNKSIDFQVEKTVDNLVVLLVPSLKSGSYQYQVFIRRLTNNQEFIVLQGRIEVINKVINSDEALYPQSTVAEVVLNADTTEVSVTINEGTKGDKGDKGDKGEDGVTPQFIMFNPMDGAIIQNDEDPNSRDKVGDNLIIGNNNSVTGFRNVILGTMNGTNDTETSMSGGNIGIGFRNTCSGLRSVAIGEGAKCQDSIGIAIGINNFANFNSITIGREAESNLGGVSIGYLAFTGIEGVAVGSAATGDIYSVSIGGNADSCKNGVTIGYNSEAGNNGVAVGYGASAPMNSIAIGNGAVAEQSVILLKTDKVELKATEAGIYLNGKLIASVE